MTKMSCVQHSNRWIMEQKWYEFEVWLPGDEADDEGCFYTEEESGFSREDARQKLKEYNPEMVILKDKD